MAVSEKLVETLINYAKAETRSECEQEARNYLDISSDQDNMSCVVVLRGETRLALRNAIRARRWRRNTPHDCSGLVFMSSCELLRIGRSYEGFYAVVTVTHYLDV